ncbi:uncharacterized protein LOC131876195 [Cryptomeria japonica]|nr:uncharacterized protein LOC131876195 [Cryptomeria japonica]
MKALSPLPYLGKAHDYYVRSLNKWAAKANYSGLAASVSSATTLPKSFTTASARKDDEYGEVVRAASQRRCSSSSSSSNLGLYKLASSEQALARSRSAAPSVGTIHEDGTCYFPASLPKTVSAAASPLPSL